MMLSVGQISLYSGASPRQPQYVVVLPGKDFYKKITKLLQNVTDFRRTDMKYQKILYASALLLLLAGCGKKNNNELPTMELVGVNGVPSDAGMLPPEEEIPEEPEVVYEPVRIHLMAIGDNLLHMGMVNSGLQGDGSYNFDFEFAPLADYLALSDIAIINQETPLAGNDRGFSGYPSFNSPTEVADAEAKAGFNVILGATNHAFDQGTAGLISYADYVTSNHPDVLMCGIHGTWVDPNAPADTSVTSEENSSEENTTDENTSEETPAENASVSNVSTGNSNSNTAPGNNRIHLLEINGYTFAILNYTYGTNLESYPSSLEGHLDMLCAYDESSRIIDFNTLNPYVVPDIQQADEIADIVIVCPHWGVEYQNTENDTQRRFAEAMIDAGADVIIGTHPHVVQPVKWITTEAGNEGLVYYSLGNYVSTQKQKRSMLELMAWVTFLNDEEGNLHILREECGGLPIICQYTYGPMRFANIYTVDEYTDELGASHGIASWGEGRLYANEMNTWSDELLQGWRITRAQILGEEPFGSDTSGSDQNTEDDTSENSANDAAPEDTTSEDSAPAN